MINSLFPHKRYSFISESVLKNLPKEINQLIEENISCIKIKKGQVLYHEGTIATGLFILRKGRIKKYTTSIEGKEHIFYLAKENEILGHHALISEEPHSCSTASLSDCQLDFIPKEIFLMVIHTCPEVMKRLLKSIAHEFGVFISNSRILAQHSVRERCAISLIKLNDFFKKQGEEGFRISRKDHSNIVGTSVESLVRVLHDFKEEGLISIQEHCIIIEKPKKLVNVSNMI